MSDQVIFHLGAHRTGTTYTQAIFTENRSILEKEEIFFQKFQDRRGLVKAVIAAREAIQKDKVKLFNKRFTKVEKYLKEVTNRREKVCFISYEGILGSINLARAGGIYPASELIAQELKKILAGKQVTFVFNIRNYADYIESTYKYSVWRGLSLTFDEYIAKVNLESSSWLNIIKGLKETFGEENILVWSYEKFAEDKEATFSWMFEKASIDNSFVKKLVIPTEAKNASASDKAISLMLEINPIIADHAKKLKIKKKRLAKKVNSCISEELSVKNYGPPSLIDDGLREELNIKYLDDIEQIKKLIPNRSFF